MHALVGSWFQRTTFFARYSSGLVLRHGVEMWRLTTVSYAMAHFHSETNLKFRQALTATHNALANDDPVEHNLSSFNGN